MGKFIEIETTYEYLIIRSIDYEELNEIKSFIYKTTQIIKEKLLDLRVKDKEKLIDSIQLVDIKDVYENLFSFKIFLFFPVIKHEDTNEEIYSSEIGISCHQLFWSLVEFLDKRGWNFFTIIPGENKWEKVYFFNKY